MIRKLARMGLIRWMQILILALLTAGCVNSNTPAGLNASLSELVNRASNSNLWPTNSIEAEEFINDLGRLIGGLSPLEEATYFPRLSELRWMAIGFDALHLEPMTAENGDTGESPYSLAVQLRGIAEEKPEFIDSDLQNSLSALAKRLLKRAEALENRDIDQRLDQANQFLTSGLLDYPREDDSIFELLDFLGYYESVQEDRAPEISHVRKQLENRLAEALDKPRREYQAWALERIWEFERAVEEIQQDEGFRFFDPIPDNWTWEEEEFLEIQREMINHLLSIDQALLELPVLKRFQSGFEIAWDILGKQDERKAQNCIAIASALVAKRSFDNVSDFDPRLDRVYANRLWGEQQCVR
ncbi:MAG: hypothetical protein F4Z20_04350 [Gammaproteobacteria bacterium]|nr:hypothetical protein [Gammaproteobacteria bacterium]